MFAAYTAVFVGLAFASDIIPVEGFLSIFSIFSFMLIALSLNANLWFTRNIGLISNLEKEFLEDGDYGVLIPETYKNKIPFASFKIFEVWWVLIVAYFAISLVVFAVLFPQITDCTNKLIVLSVYLVSLFLTILYGVFLNIRHNKFKNGAPGKNTKN